MVSGNKFTSILTDPLPWLPVVKPTIPSLLSKFLPVAATAFPSPKSTPYMSNLVAPAKLTTLNIVAILFASSRDMIAGYSIIAFRYCVATLSSYSAIPWCSAFDAQPIPLLNKSPTFLVTLNVCQGRL
ncbi:hypothetical protein RND81_09G167400 [Saponaria officinalis]|uniref:Uncharacterized protein n=1 Tax=Saponaria officinalis TaxID=3572 RepID=A0AAW1IMK1_SAPOF